MKKRRFWQRKGSPTPDQRWDWVKNLFSWGSVGCLLGLFTVLAVSYIEVIYHPETRLAKVAIEFLKHIGVAFLVLGLVGIILDFRHWREYFQERLAEIVMKRSYLRTLEREELITLQTDTLKAFFKDENIDRKDSFLHHFHSKIRDFIGSPYREDAFNSMIVREADGEDGYVVEDHLSYTCRKVGECIQPMITWSLDREDIKHFQDVKFSLTIPNTVYQTDDFKEKHPEFTTRKTVIEQAALIDPEERDSYKYDLEKLSDIDELQVSIDARYIIRKDSYFSWFLSLPSRGLSLAIRYPRHLEVSVQTFGMEEEELDIDKKNGFYSMRYKSWVLPTNGYVFQLRAARPPQTQKKTDDPITNSTAAPETHV